MKRIIIIGLTILLLISCEQESSKQGVVGSTQPYSQMLVYPQKKPIESFQLTRQDAEGFNEKSFLGRWNLLFMGYTNCPDVCPTTLMDMANIYKKINPELQKKFQVIFLSVDPARDNLEHMANYIDHFHDDFVAITGEKSEIDKLVFSIGGIYSLNSEDAEYYSVDHTGRIFIINPQGERFGIVTSEAMHSNDKSILVDELNQLAR